MSSSSNSFTRARSPTDGLGAAWELEELEPGFGPDCGSPPEPAGGAPDPLAAAEDAVERTERRLEEMQREREAAVAEAYREGVESGRREAEAAAAARLRTAVESVEQVLARIPEAEADWAAATEEHLCALATAIARQIVGRELEIAPETVMDMVRAALSEFPLEHPVQIRLNPADHAALTAAGGLPARAARDIRWIADTRVAPGGCVLEGPDRIVDGRVDFALERIYRKLTDHHA